MRDISQTIESEVEKWKKATVSPSVHSASDINSGHCKAFANDIKQMFSGSKLHIYAMNEPTYTSFAHAWVEYNGKHYDAECPEGVEHPRFLPLFQRAELDPLSPEEQHLHDVY